ncbi:MAG TPA: hypothetical protein VHV51_23870 [Polyangiaceae bacterium]|nr:hypothetical protein [Polyangiaceae bacterium]
MFAANAESGAKKANAASPNLNGRIAPNRALRELKTLITETRAQTRRPLLAFIYWGCSCAEQCGIFAPQCDANRVIFWTLKQTHPPSLVFWRGFLEHRSGAYCLYVSTGAQ